MFIILDLTRRSNAGPDPLDPRRPDLEFREAMPPEGRTDLGDVFTSREVLTRFLDSIIVPAGPQTASQPQKPTVTARMVAATQKAEDMGV